MVPNYGKVRKTTIKCRVHVKSTPLKGLYARGYTYNAVLGMQ